MSITHYEKEVCAPGDIRICSRKAIKEKMSDPAFFENAAVISFYDPPGKRRDSDYRPVDYTKCFASHPELVFQVAVHDIDLSVLPEYGLDVESYFTEADELAEFIFAAWKKGLNIICQCEYGESRSAACAAAIHQYFLHDGIDIFADYRYYPNQLIYHKVYNALEKYGQKGEKPERSGL